MLNYIVRPIAWAIVAYLAVCSQAQAQTVSRTPEPELPEWVILPVSADTDDTPAVLAETRSLLTDAGARFAPEDAASMEVERRISVDPMPIDANDIERWASRSREALRHLSRGDYEAARRALLEAQAISERAAEALNRESLRARQVLDTCLFIVRTAIETGDHVGAEAQARRCRLLVPRMQASAYTHTPEVRALVARVDVALANETAGELFVDSDRRDCVVRVNGVRFGATPMRTRELPFGEYRVQVECDELVAGRVHTVTLGQDDVAVHVDSIFDRVLRARPFVSLRYPSATFADEHARSHGRIVARKLGRPVLLVSRAGGKLHLLAIDGRGRARTPLELDLVASPERTAQLTDYLGDVTHGSRPHEPTPPPSPHRAAGFALVGVGASGLGASIGLLSLRNARGDDFAKLATNDVGYLDAQMDLFRLRVALDTLATFGAVAASTGGGLAVRGARHRTPKIGGAHV